MNQPEAAQHLFPKGKILQLGDEDSPVVADYDIFHCADPADEQGYLSAGVAACLDQAARQLCRDEIVGGEAAPVEALQAIELAVL